MPPRSIFCGRTYAFHGTHFRVTRPVIQCCVINCTMIFESVYADPLDFIAKDDTFHVYESLEDSLGSVANILGGPEKPPKAPTPLLKKRRMPLAERSSNLPPPPTNFKQAEPKKCTTIEVEAAKDCRSRKDRFLFWKSSSSSSSKKEAKKSKLKKLAPT